jgi:hypothetical protein
MKNIATILFLLSTALVGCRSVQPTPLVRQKALIPAPIEVDAKVFFLSRIVTQIPLGDRVLNIQHGWGCFKGNHVDWRGGRISLTDEEFDDGFRKEFTKLNYKVAGDPSALFDDNTINRADFLVAGAIEKIQTNVCFPFSGSPDASFGITSELKGSTYMRVRWQIYDKVSEKVVLETTSEGSFEAPEVVTSSIPLFLKNAFQANVRNLLAEPRIFELSKPSSPKRNSKSL